MFSSRAKFILAVLAQTLVILTIIIFKVAVLSGGTDVLLRIAPVDPRDWLRGDYATFRYDISDVQTNSISRERQFFNGETAYVLLLRRSDGVWTENGVRKDRPTDGTVFIKGRVERGGELTEGSSGAQSLHIVYGAEQYFIPEGEGRNLSFWNKKVTARVAVDDDGNAVLRQLYIEGKPWP